MSTNEATSARLAAEQFIFNRIPSESLRKHMEEQSPKLSLLQWASIAHCVLQGTELAEAFSKLEACADDVYEKALLAAAVEDIRELGYVDQRAQTIFETKHIPHTFPLFPFLERRFLPVLLKPGDIARCHFEKGDGFGYVYATPEHLPEGSDFTDECYLCYDLDAENPADLFAAHFHPHVCFTDAHSIDALTEKQQESLAMILVALKERESQK